MSGLTRDYTRFFTLPMTARFMACLLNPQDNDHILEPSAGDGALVRALKYVNPRCHVDAVEIDSQWYIRLCDSGSKQVFRDDFLHFKPGIMYDKIIANPPFGNGTDVQAHFDKMWSHLKPGGLIACILPKYLEVANHKEYLRLPRCIRYPLVNWGTNSDGTITEIELILAQKPADEAYGHIHFQNESSISFKPKEFLG